MTKTWQTGTIARAMAKSILRRDLSRPKRRSTRRARMTRATPVGSLVTTSETRDMPTTNMSSQHHGSEMNGINQYESAITTSSALKMIVKKRLMWSRADPKLVRDPSASTSSLAYCDSRMVHMKLCAQSNQALRRIRDAFGNTKIFALDTHPDDDKCEDALANEVPVKLTYLSLCSLKGGGPTRSLSCIFY